MYKDHSVWFSKPVMGFFFLKWDLWQVKFVPFVPLESSSHQLMEPDEQPMERKDYNFSSIEFKCENNSEL